MDILTKEIALEKVEEIKKVAAGLDDEAAHVYEDELRHRFICCLAAGMYEKDEAIELAEIIKSTSEIDFSRWCA